MHNRKTSAYLPRNELHSENSRKTSAYFTSVGYLIKDNSSKIDHLDTVFLMSYPRSFAKPCMINWMVLSISSSSSQGNSGKSR
jgi:hypothetical protein